ncbi:MAG: hypothetical protein WCT11_04030 [Candidatus Magasanikbacteria bacterium]
MFRKYFRTLAMCYIIVLFLTGGGGGSDGCNCSHQDEQNIAWFCDILSWVLYGLSVALAVSMTFEGKLVLSTPQRMISGCAALAGIGCLIAAVKLDGLLPSFITLVLWLVAMSLWMVKMPPPPPSKSNDDRPPQV